jgi:hypothetical protein
MDGVAVRFACADERAVPIIRILRLRYARHRLRGYCTGPGTARGNAIAR